MSYFNELKKLDEICLAKNDLVKPPFSKATLEQLSLFFQTKRDHVLNDENKYSSDNEMSR